MSRRAVEVDVSAVRIVGGTVVSLDADRRIIEGGEVAFTAGRVDYVGPVRDGEQGEVIDATGKAVMPGMVNAHTHVAMTLMRSYADDMPLQPWLETKIWPLEAHLRPEDVYHGTMLGALEMIRGGVTCFHDMYWHADQAARAGLDSGLRTCPSGVLIGVIPQADQMLEEAIAFVDQCLANPHPRLHVRFGPHAPYTVPDPYLEEIIAAAAERGVAIHIHLSETEHEVQTSIEQHGERPVDHMKTVGLFSVPVCAAHCVHVEPHEIETLIDSQVGILASHTSNLKLGCGIVPLPDFLAGGATVGLGTDGTASNNNLDMFEELRLAALLHKGVRKDATVVNAFEALEMATWRGAEAVGLTDVGRLAEGYRADLICVDMTGPHVCPGLSAIADLAYAAQAADVSDVFVEGTALMRDRQLVALDEAAIMAQARESASYLMSKV